MTTAEAKSLYYGAYPGVPYIQDDNEWLAWWKNWWMVHGAPAVSLVAASYPVDAQIMQAIGWSPQGEVNPVQAEVTHTVVTTPIVNTTIPVSLGPSGDGNGLNTKGSGFLASLNFIPLPQPAASYLKSNWKLIAGVAGVAFVLYLLTRRGKGDSGSTIVIR